MVLIALCTRSIWASVSNEESRSLRWLGLGAAFTLTAELGGAPGARMLLLLNALLI